MNWTASIVITFQSLPLAAALALARKRYGVLGTE